MKIGKEKRKNKEIILNWCYVLEVEVIKYDKELLQLLLCIHLMHLETSRFPIINNHWLSIKLHMKNVGYINKYISTCGYKENFCMMFCSENITSTFIKKFPQFNIIWSHNMKTKILKIYTYVRNNVLK